MKKISIEIPSLTENIRMIESFIDNAKEKYHLNDDIYGNIMIAVTEAVNNAIKYAHARHIAVTFHSSASNVDFTVTDDGIGLDPGSASAGHGLSNMRQRALNTGGELLVNGSNGTTISFHLAL